MPWKCLLMVFFGNQLKAFFDFKVTSQKKSFYFDNILALSLIF